MQPLCNQLFIKPSVYHLNTLQTCNRRIENVRNDVYKKNQHILLPENGESMG